MAARKRSVVDYAQLHTLSSVVLYDTTTKRRKNKDEVYDVERIIERRKIKHDHKYLIKWQDWPLHNCSWEPSENLPENLIRGYENPPKPSEERLEEACYHFMTGIISALKSASVSPIYVHMKLDVWRYLSYGKGTACQHQGHFLYSKCDFGRFKLPEHWCYYLNVHGEGKAVDLPIKIKPVLSWSPIQHVMKSGRLIEASRFPVEKLCVTFVKRACNINNI